MNKTLVIYQSKYGHTKKYAQWLSEELNADICDAKKLKNKELSDYSTIVFGGSLHFFTKCKVALLLVEHFEQVKDKKVALFTVGVYDSFSEESMISFNKLIKGVITPEIAEKIKIFHLRGGINFKKLSLWHKILLKFFRSRMLKMPENERNEFQNYFLSVYGKNVDFMDKKTLAPMIQYCLQK